MSFYGSTSANGNAGQGIDDLLQMLGQDNSIGNNSASASFIDQSELGYGSSTVSGSVVGTAGYLSQIESAILKSRIPIEIDEIEEITVLGQKGIWTNRREAAQWTGDVPLSDYSVNEDQQPEIITKKTAQTLEYVQELAVRYLRPPTPPAPGEIIITQLPNTATAPAPPLIIRQQPARAETPEPMVIREAPPEPPISVGRKVITISGKRLPPPPRKVIIERLAPLPSKPQNIIIERWLPYNEVKRRVIFNRSTVPDPVVAKPRNVIVQWEAPQVSIRKEIKYLGVIRANPAEYVQKYGASLKKANQLPDFVLDIRTPDDIGTLAADYKYNSVYELEGEIEGLRFVDLEKEGLSEYRPQLMNLGVGNHATMSYASGFSASGSGITNTSISSISASALVQQIINQLDSDGSGTLSLDEANSIFIRINSRIGRSCGQFETNQFFQNLRQNSNGRIDLNEFKQAFDELI